MSIGNGEHMKCPCGGDLDAVMDSRPRMHKEFGQIVARRRKCAACGARTGTIEIHENTVADMQREVAKTLLSKLLEDFLLPR